MDPQIVGLLILATVFGSAIFMYGRFQQNVTSLLIWAFIILALVFGYNQYEKMKFDPDIVEGRPVVDIPYDDRAGGYRIIAYANDRPINAIIDTGATTIVLTFDDAEAAGIAVDDLSFSVPVSTAGGTAYNAATRLDRLAIGDDVIFDNVEVFIASQGDLEISLLGQSFLRKTAGYQVDNNIMRLRF